MSQIYPGGDHQISPNLGLALWGIDEVTTDNFLLIDTAFGSVGGSIKVNGSIVSSPNFVNSASVTFGVVGSNISLTASGGGTPGGSSGQVQGNNSGVFGGMPGSVIDFTNGTLGIAPPLSNASVAALSITGDSSGSNSILDLFVNGSISPAVSVDTNGSILAFIGIDTPQLTVLNGNISIGSGGNPSTLKDFNGSAGTSGQLLSSTSTGVLWVNAGTGTVSSFSAGTLSPLFTTSVSTPTTTPALTFSLSNAGGGTVFGNNAVGSAAPTYTTTPVLGVPGTSTGSIAIASSTASGKFTITAPASAATPTLTLPTTSNVLAGQFAGDGTVLASTLAIASAAGTVTAALANAGGGTILGNNTTGSTTPSYTISPVLGIPGTSTGTISLASSTASGKFTLTAPASASTPTLTLPTTSNVLAGQFAGDGTIFNATLNVASAAGTLSPTLLTQTANFVLAGPTSGAAAAPTFRALVTADIPSGTVLWNQIGNAGGALTLANGGNSTTFNQTSAVAWLWANTTLAVSGTAQSSPLLELTGNSWSGAAAVTDTWTIQNVCANSTTIAGTSELKILHSAGTTGSAIVDVAAVTSTNGTTGGPFISGGLGFDGTKASNASSPAVFGAASASMFAFIPSSSTSVNQVCELAIYTNAATTTASKSWNLLANSNNGGNASLTIAAQQNVAGQSMVLASGMGTSAVAPGITLGGNGGGNAKDFQATSGTQIAVAVGSGTIGRVSFTPTSGSAAFVGLQVSPTVNQTGGASGNYTALKVNVVETALGGSANLLLDLQAGATGGTSELAITNKGVVSQYAAVATVSQGVPAEYATVDLTNQSAAIGSTLLYAVPASSSGMYRISWSADITTAAATPATSILGGTNGFQILVTSPTDSVVKTFPRTVTSGVDTDSTNTTATGISGVIVVYAASSTNINYKFDYTNGGATAMVYELHVKCERM